MCFKECDEYSSVMSKYDRGPILNDKILNKRKKKSFHMRLTYHAKMFPFIEDN